MEEEGSSNRAGTTGGDSNNIGTGGETVQNNMPTACIVVGMGGRGKFSLMQEDKTKLFTTFFFFML